MSSWFSYFFGSSSQEKSGRAEEAGGKGGKEESLNRGGLKVPPPSRPIPETLPRDAVAEAVLEAAKERLPTADIPDDVSYHFEADYPALALACSDLKREHDACFQRWYTHEYLRGTGKSLSMCDAISSRYGVCLKAKLRALGLEEEVFRGRAVRK